LETFSFLESSSERPVRTSPTLEGEEAPKEPAEFEREGRDDRSFTKMFRSATALKSFQEVPGPKTGGAVASAGWTRSLRFLPDRDRELLP
jgi:hypothetical protein